MPTIAQWNDPGCRFSVEYSREALEQLRRTALDGLLALPRVGLGVGGLLLGLREDNKITVLDSIAIPCGHAMGPSFALTAEEIEHAVEIDRTVEIARTVARLSVVGWYCSKTRAPATFSEPDLILHAKLCPENWQVALLIQPHTAAPSRAEFWFRDAEGHLVRHPEFSLGAFDPSSVPPVVQPVAPPVVPPVVVAPVARPVVQPDAPPRPRARRWRWIVVASALIAGTAGAFFTRDEWMARPQLDLRASEVDGHMTIRWNRDAVHGIDHGSLTITDGAQSLAIPLEANQLDAGALQYYRKSGQISAVLKAGNVEGRVGFP